MEQLCCRQGLSHLTKIKHAEIVDFPGKLLYLCFKMIHIENRIIKTELVAWKSIVPFQGELKTLTNNNFEKLKQSLRQNNFVQPLNVWENGKLWCLDGHQRLRILESLEKDGVEIPDKLPANFIQCANKKEAQKLVLRGNIQLGNYQSILNQGLLLGVHIGNMGLAVEKNVYSVNIHGSTNIRQKIRNSGINQAIRNARIFLQTSIGVLLVDTWFPVWTG